ncbi:hypothetical protein [Paenibacillus marinisediminis]
MRFMIVFWGLLFVLLDFKVQGFDILPDIIGLILLIIGYTQLSSENEHFKRARTISIVYAVITIMTWVFPINYDIGMSPSTLTGIAILLSFIFVAVDLILIYSHCSGIEEVARKLGQYEFAERAMSRWKYYWMAAASALVALLFAFLSASFAMILILVAGIAIIVVSVLLLKLTYDAGKLV